VKSTFLAFVCINALAVAGTVNAQSIGRSLSLSRSQIADLCMSVGEQLTGGKPGERKYAFDRDIRRWSGVDSQQEITAEMASRIQRLWAANQQFLACNSLGFSVRNGSIWKLAIEKDSEDFLEMALIDWGLVPNDLDCTGETPLDYAIREMGMAGQTGRARILRRYRDLLLEHGAKRASELTAEERSRAPNCFE
jgi:hypothetical protein